MKTMDEQTVDMHGEYYAGSGVAEAAHTRVIIGLGNAHKGDDAAGLHVARQLAARKPKDAQVLESQGDGDDLIAAWRDSHSAYIIAAVISGQRPGYVYRFDLNKDPLPEYLFSPCSDYGLELADVLDRARATNQLPEKLTLYAIEGIDFSSGSKLSPEVEKGIKTVVQCLMIDLV